MIHVASTRLPLSQSQSQSLSMSLSLSLSLPQSQSLFLSLSPGSSASDCAAAYTPAQSFRSPSEPLGRTRGWIPSSHKSRSRTHAHTHTRTHAHKHTSRSRRIANIAPGGTGEDSPGGAPPPPSNAAPRAPGNTHLSSSHSSYPSPLCSRQPSARPRPASRLHAAADSDAPRLKGPGSESESRRPWHCPAGQLLCACACACARATVTRRFCRTPPTAPPAPPFQCRRLLQSPSLRASLGRLTGMRGGLDGITHHLRLSISRAVRPRRPLERAAAAASAMWLPLTRRRRKK
jgi:hypothetical protein